MKKGELLAFDMVEKAFRPESSSRNQDLVWLLNTRAVVEERRDSEKLFLIDKDCPGYLKSENSERSITFSPLNLVEVAPTKQTRYTLEQKSAAFQMNDTLNICLSGSATFLGVTSNIGDVDFAEYLLGEEQAISSGLSRIVNQSIVNDFEFTGFYVKYIRGGGDYFKHPINSDFILSQISRKGCESLSWIGSADLSAIGLDRVEFTNKVFPIKHASDVKGNSWIYQEMVFLPSSETPQRKLSEGTQLAGYLNFLVKESGSLGRIALRKKCTKRAVKGLKRAISLALMLGVRNLFRQGFALLPKTSVDHVHIENITNYIRSVIELFEKVMSQKGADERYSG